MAERPILFSAPMVRAILSGAKTQTRRICKPQPHSVGDHFSTRQHGTLMIRAHDSDAWKPIPCPYGAPGDVLWVKETWRTRARLDHLSPKDIELAARSAGHSTGPCGPLQYIADGHSTQWGDCDLQDFGPWGKTRVSIHMPRWASRLKLRIKSVRVERLQEISEADVIREGLDLEGEHADWFAEGERLQSAGAPMSGERYAFMRLWDSINGGPKHIRRRRAKGKPTDRYDAAHVRTTPAGAWAANPFVWVIEFERQ